MDRHRRIRRLHSPGVHLLLRDALHQPQKPHRDKRPHVPAGALHHARHLQAGSDVPDDPGTHDRRAHLAGRAGPARRGCNHRRRRTRYRRRARCVQCVHGSGELVQPHGSAVHQDRPGRPDTPGGEARDTALRLRHRLTHRPGHAGRQHQPPAGWSRHHRTRGRARLAADAQQLLRGNERALRGNVLSRRLHRAAGRSRGLRAAGGTAEHEGTDLAQQRGHHPQLGYGQLHHGELQPAPTLE